MLRSSLESALYGLHIARNPRLAEVWFQRQDSSKHKAQVRKEFSFVTLIRTLEQEDKDVTKVAKTLYEQCIDWGAHPNEQAFMQNLKMDENEQRIKFEYRYLNPDRPTLDLALKSAARVGVCVLLIFLQVFKERFDILGITATLPELRHDYSFPSEWVTGFAGIRSVRTSGQDYIFSVVVLSRIN